MNIFIEKALSKQNANIIKTQGLQQAAVAICLRERNEQLEILFMRRAIDINDPWSGQICFPGGRCEDFDENSQSTAQRETKEEVGIDLYNSQFLGRCDDECAPVISSDKKIHISVYAYFLSTSARTKLNYEVASSAWVSADTLANKAHYRKFEHPNTPELLMEGIAINAMRLGSDDDPILWGLTLRILSRFFSKLDRSLAASL